MFNKPKCFTYNLEITRKEKNHNMKKTKLKSLFCLAISSLALSGVLTSCSVDEYVASKDEIMKQLSEFAFETSDNVVLDINYGPLASRALVKVYDENPLANATQEDETPKGETVFTTFLDEEGRFVGEVNIPAHVNHLYFYTASMAAPMLMDAKLDGNEVKVMSKEVAARTANATRSTRTVADDQLVVRKLNSSENGGTAKNFYTIYDGWDNYGRVNDVNGLVDVGALTEDDVKSIEHYFWYIGESATKWIKPGNPEGDRLTRLRNLRVDDVNMLVQEQYEENGQIHDVESAEVWFTFLTEYAWNQNTVGYYFFNKNNPPKSPAEIDKKFIILPHASKPNEAPFGVKGNELYHNEYAPTYTNQRVQLLYVDENGKVSKNFPPNTEIGFFLIANGFKCDNPNVGTETIDGITYNTRVNGKINTNGTTYYSNYQFNGGSLETGTSANKNPNKRFVACRLANGTVVYGCEDGGNESYDDMMFTLTASPNKAIHTKEGSELQSIPQKYVPRTYTDKSENYTYAFENMWPDGGDYDLNDVIVRLKRTITKDQFNAVSKVVDNFSFEVNQHTASSCSFAIQTSHKGDRYTLPTGAWYEEETGSFFLADDVRNSNVNHKTLTLTREFDHPVTLDQILNELNPFIVNQSKGVDCHTNGRVEIHLPMGEVTSMGMHIDNTKNPAKAWYISDDGKAPYALKIPGTTFDPCDERVRIGSGSGAYPNFHKWVNSLGKEYKDWYMNK